MHRDDPIYTISAHSSESPQVDGSPHTMPVFQTTSRRFADLDSLLNHQEAKGYIYGREGHENSLAIEETVAAMEKGDAALATSSGIGAIGAILRVSSGPDAPICVANNIYGGTYKLLQSEFAERGTPVHFAEPTPEGVRSVLEENPCAVVYLETISNPLLEVPDLTGIAEVAHAAGALVVVDNTFATPYHLRPLRVGADVTIHSATKFLNGHGDVIGGVAVGPVETIEAARTLACNWGLVPSPIDAWLFARGLRTFAVRMERQSRNAADLAEWLHGDPRVKKVYYPGNPDHRSHANARDLLIRGFGAVVSIELEGGRAAAEQFLRALTLFPLVPSLGDVASSVSVPRDTSHKAIPEDVRESMGVTDGLLRISVGCESLTDLKEDLAEALDYMNKKLGE